MYISKSSNRLRCYLTKEEYEHMGKSMYVGFEMTRGQLKLFPAVYETGYKVFIQPSGTPTIHSGDRTEHDRFHKKDFARCWIDPTLMPDGNLLVTVKGMTLPEYVRSRKLKKAVVIEKKPVTPEPVSDADYIRECLQYLNALPGMYQKRLEGDRFVIARVVEEVLY